MDEIRDEASSITKKFSKDQGFRSHPIDIDDLKENFDMVFIGLHGRPGEDGELQGILESKGIPFNGSQSSSSQLTINKYLSNELLKSNGIRIPKHELVEKEDWFSDPEIQAGRIEKEFGFPIICKPADDGCSSAVKRISNKSELIAFAEMAFRKNRDWPTKPAELLGLDPKEEFPRKDFFLIEELIEKGDSERFLEITGGLLTQYDDFGNISYTIFNPSEALTSGDVLTLEEKFLAGEGQNITPARFWGNTGRKREDLPKGKEGT